MSENTTSILIAEDNDSERKFMKEFLVRQGYFVIEAATGTEAIQLSRELNPDIIVSDLRMPDLDGLELLEIIKDEFELTPFIIVSGLGTMDDVILGLRLGAWDYLTKPIYPIELLQHSISRVLERAELLIENQRHQEKLEKLIKKRTIALIDQNQAYREEIKERQKQQEQARNAENEWRRTVDALPEMIAIVGKDMKIQRLNQPMLDFIGERKDDIIGKTCFLCDNNHYVPQDKILSDSGLCKKEIFLEEQQIYLDLTVVPYSSPDGVEIGFIHVFRDITHQKTNEKEKDLLQTKNLHTQKLESVGQLAAGIAHEINTPTQFVSSNVEFIDDAFIDIGKSIREILCACSEGNVTAEKITSELANADWNYLEEEIPAAIKQSKEGLTRITSIVRAMKEFSHPGSRESEVVDLNHLIDVTVTVARNEWKYVADMELDLDPDLPNIPCLSDEMGQVVLNLLVNAAHAIEEKIGRTPEKNKGTITIKSSLENDLVVASITDTGSGIPEHVQDKIFDPFFTTKAVGHGTGQGLAIAYDVVTNKHQGSLTFNSTIEEGTTFILKLPINRE